MEGARGACSPFPTPPATFCLVAALCQAGAMPRDSSGAEPRGFAPEQTAWPCLCSQPIVRWHRWRLYPEIDSDTEDLHAVSRLSGCENMLSRYTEREAGEF